MNKVTEIIKNLINLIGVTVGIVIMSIGAIMLISSFLKVYVFHIEYNGYDDFSYKCEQFDVDFIEANRLRGNNFGSKPAIMNSENEKQVAKLTEAEREKLRKKYKECKKEAQQEAHKKFLVQEKIHLATGIAFVVVGIPLLIYYQKRSRKEKKKE